MADTAAALEAPERTAHLATALRRQFRAPTPTPHHQMMPAASLPAGPATSRLSP
jgi:hypothetical protein